MKLSRKITISVLTALCVAVLGVALGLMLVGTKTAVAATTDVSHYFYNQLGDEQKEFYKAMEEMHEKGIFIAGDDYDLVESNPSRRLSLKLTPTAILVL